MYREVGEKHHTPHYHTRYADYEASYRFDGTLESGWLPSPQHKKVVKWAVKHSEDLERNWMLLESKSQTEYIEPLK
jgi:hypothetical protein